MLVTTCSFGLICSTWWWVYIYFALTPSCAGSLRYLCLPLTYHLACQAPLGFFWSLFAVSLVLVSLPSVQPCHPPSCLVPVLPALHPLTSSPPGGIYACVWCTLYFPLLNSSLVECDLTAGIHVWLMGPTLHRSCQNDPASYGPSSHHQRCVCQGDDPVMDYTHLFLDVASNLAYGEADELSLLYIFFYGLADRVKDGFDMGNLPKILQEADSFLHHGCLQFLAGRPALLPLVLSLSGQSQWLHF